MKSMKRSIPVPPAFRGNCECGRWLIVPMNVSEDDPLRCECGRRYWFEGQSFCMAGESDKSRHLEGEYDQERETE